MTPFFALERTVEPDYEPVSLAEAKQQVREFSSLSTAGEDELSRLITTAREWAERETGRALVDQTWRLTLCGAQWPVDTVAGSIYPYRYDWRTEIPLRRSPVLEIVSVATVDSLGVETTIDAATYEVREADSKWPRLVALSGSTWNVGTGDLRITFRAGHIDTSTSPATGTVPARFKQAILLYLESLYDRDEKMMEKLQTAATNLLRGECAELSIG